MLTNRNKIIPVCNKCHVNGKQGFGETEVTVVGRF